MNDDAISTPTAFEPLTFEQARVLGCLMEKEVTTPDAYPLTLNSLVTACNQATNRDPVVTFAEVTVQDALDVLKARQFVYQLSLAGARVQKFRHNMVHKFPGLEAPESALLCTLLLRGAQTVGELRQRTERLHAFSDLAAVEYSLQKLLSSEHDMALAVMFPPGNGRKSASYMHTLCGEPSAPVTGAAVQAEAAAAVSNYREEEKQWREKMEQEIAGLRAELRSLKEKLGEE
ncbi:MAG: hypothetical protein JWO94_365 [Verrucomicrobiaceae bacterium]|nr:hypothetical protein [Verrucomicrobiaceae bacterium]